MLKMSTNSLVDIQVLVTRPAHQAQALCELLAEQGAQVIRLPVIEIEAIALSAKMAAIIDTINEIDFAVFISPNAVEHGLAVLFAQGRIPDKLKLVTIGKASAQKMQQLLGRAPDIFPKEQYNSEALLALDSLQSNKVNNKKIIIFRGQGGRELLASSLKQRGARVEYIEVYQRKMPELQSSVLESIWNPDGGGSDCRGSNCRGSNCRGPNCRGPNSPDIIIVTSNEGLRNLVAMIACSSDEQHDSYLQQLRQTPLVVVTEKMRLSAQNLGFKNAIMIAARASDDALLESVLEWAKIRK